MPQYSSRYGLPSSEIHILASKTGITDEDRIEFKDNPRFDFRIQYLHPFSGEKTAPLAWPAIKWILIDF
jgi:hypothetical protein